MRELRPTIRALKSLPRDTFHDPEPYDLIANEDFKRLRLYGVAHPMMEDGRRQFEQGTLSRHTEASRNNNRQVFEVRDHDGAGWRGAVVFDKDGDPWLVWVERHDHFHARVAKVNFNEAMPTSAEYKLRDREEAAQQKAVWQTDLLGAFVDGLETAIRDGKPAQVEVPGDHGCVEISVEHGEPAADFAAAHDTSSLVTITLRISARNRADFEQAVLHVCLPFLQPVAANVSAAYGSSGMTILVDISHAKIVQLLADVDPEHGPRRVAPEPPTLLHYVGVDFLVAGYVNAEPVRGVCGEWFVPTRDENAELPICADCENEKPAAEAVLDLLRARD